METSSIGTLILHVTYHSLQPYNRLSGRAKYAKGKVHGFRICHVSPRHPPLQEIQLLINFHLTYRRLNTYSLISGDKGTPCAMQYIWLLL